MSRTLCLSVLLCFYAFIQPRCAQAITLDQSFQQALKKNESWEQSKNKVDQADARFSQVRGAVMPNIALNGSYFLQPQLADPIAREIFPNQQTTINLSVTQPVFRGFREFAALKQQSKLVDAQESAHQTSTLRLYQSVAQSYFNILTLEQDLKNLEQQADIYGKRVGELQARVRRGESATSEALTAQSAEVSTQSEIQVTQSQLAAERENFGYLTGLESDVALTDPQLVFKTGKKAALEKLDNYLKGIEQRPDVLEAKQRLEASEKEVTIARGGHYPSVDFVGNYYFLRPPGFLKEINWDIQLKVTLPIFEGFATHAKIVEASSRSKDAELELHRVRRQALQEVRTLYQNVRIKLDQMDILSRSLEIANRNSETLQKEYRRGLSRNIDVQVALADYRMAKRAVDQTHFATQFEWIRLQIASAKLNSSQLNSASLAGTKP